MCLSYEDAGFNFPEFQPYFGANLLFKHLLKHNNTEYVPLWAQPEALIHYTCNSDKCWTLIVASI